MRKDPVPRVGGLLHTVLRIGLAFTQGSCFLLGSRSDSDTCSHEDVLWEGMPARKGRIQLYEARTKAKEAGPFAPSKETSRE